MYNSLLTGNAKLINITANENINVIFFNFSLEINKLNIHIPAIPSNPKINKLLTIVNTFR